MGLGMGIEGLCLIPLMNFIVMPVAVVAGTRLAVWIHNHQPKKMS